MRARWHPHWPLSSLSVCLGRFLGSLGGFLPHQRKNASWPSSQHLPPHPCPLYRLTRGQPPAGPHRPSEGAQEPRPQAKALFHSRGISQAPIASGAPDTCQTGFLLGLASPLERSGCPWGPDKCQRVLRISSSSHGGCRWEKMSSNAVRKWCFSFPGSLLFYVTSRASSHPGVL